MCPLSRQNLLQAQHVRYALFAYLKSKGFRGRKQSAVAHCKALCQTIGSGQIQTVLARQANLKKGCSTWMLAHLANLFR
jgi:hypothetical protein